MMKKSGFTLAELLISLTIIGVVAAITIPQVVKNVQKRQANAVLERTVEQIEVGCQNMIQAQNDKITNGAYIDKVSSIDDFTMEKLAPFIGASETDLQGEVNDIAYLPISFFIPAVSAAVSPALDGFQEDFRNNNLQDNYGPQTPELPPATIQPVPVYPENPNSGYVQIKPGLEGVGEEYKGDITFPKDKTPDEGDSNTDDEAQENEPTSGNGGYKVFALSKNSANLLVDKNVKYNKNSDDMNEVVFNLLIDTNGTKSKPNTYERDVFEYGLTNSCKMVPVKRGK